MVVGDLRREVVEDVRLRDTVGEAMMVRSLKRDAGNTEDSLCDWIQLQAINALLISIWRTEHCRSRPVFNDLVHLSIRSLVESTPLTNFRVRGATRVEVPPIGILLVGSDG